MKISNEFKIRPDPPSDCICGCPENFPIVLLFGSWCMSIKFASFLVDRIWPQIAELAAFE